ncbi:MAG: biotin--[Butyricicoccus sp.]|nr:biotin--[acetyl-CoA-carboxylase] ligase [Butyricicoccus sp.]
MTKLDMFDAEQVRAHLGKPERIGRELLVLREVDSTNTRIKQEYAAAKRDGFTLIAHSQTAGRGRLGRSFASPQGDGLYLSALLRPDLPPEQINFITTAAAVAICRAIESAAGFTPGIKWVNDILMRGKKLCGILVEAGFTGGGTLDYAVLGIGINLRFDPAAHPELADIAGGLEDFAVGTVDGAALAAAILRELDRVYVLLCAGDTAAILDEYRDRLLGIGETITVHGTDGPWQAVCTGLDAQGHLLVCDDRGEHVLSSGEISIRLAEQKKVPAKA